MRRVVITGMGAISAVGRGADPLWQAARDGVSGVRPLDLARSSLLRVKIAAQVAPFNAFENLWDGAPPTADRYAQFLLLAAAEAVAQAGLAPSDLAGQRVGAIIGTGVGGISTMDEGCFRIYGESTKCHPLSVPRVMPSSGASHVGIAHGITGPTFAITSACASASQSIGMAASMIRAGMLDRALAGGGEACMNASTIRAWELLRVLTPTACRPFSADRSGMVLGEGAGVLVLEEEQAARARGAVPLAYVDGYGTSSDATDMVQPRAEGGIVALRAALDDAGLAPQDIGYVNAHGTGTVLNDMNEAQALRAVFGAALDDIPVSSSKPIFGHALGAGGALELIVTIKALQQQTIPPQINMTRPDPRCDLNLPVDGPVSARFDAALSNSFAFGGINAVLLVSRAA